MLPYHARTEKENKYIEHLETRVNKYKADGNRN